MTGRRVFVLLVLLAALVGGFLIASALFSVDGRWTV